MKDIEHFQKEIWDFYKNNKRDFPWRQTNNPYYILISEIMLQQTQADRVVNYYNAFIKAFPDIKSLSRASFKKIYKYWQGLGYNRRAMMLKRLAEEVVKNNNGKLPASPEELETLPGIGPYTARAVAIFSHNAPVACIETNIRRVFIHFFFKNKEKVSDEDILLLAKKSLDAKNSREWHWALMDYGAHLRAAPSLSKGGNPNRRHKDYTVQSKFEGSLREIRGMILKMLSAKKMSELELIKQVKKPAIKVKKVLSALEKEGFIQQNKKTKKYQLR